jgi:hypothetical protein
MRALVPAFIFAGLLSLPGCTEPVWLVSPPPVVAALPEWSWEPLMERTRVEGFTATSPTAFLYSAQTNTVMTENDDGTAERLRRDWIADAVRAHGMCTEGYAIDTRRFVPFAQGRFANGGHILYSGRCLSGPGPVLSSPEPTPYMPPPRAHGERG